jgi:RNA 3'-terminal phosphate cyclase-like protein
VAPNFSFLVEISSQKTYPQTHKKMLTLKYKNLLLQRIVLSTLTQKPIKITHIQTEQIGLQDYEISLLRLIEKITVGTIIKISHTGMVLEYHPGILQGGVVSHECVGKGMGYFMELLVIVAPYCKQSLKITLNGLTNDGISIDLYRTLLLPQLKHVGIDGVELVLKKRGCLPKGGGQVIFSCPIVKQLKPFEIVERGLIRKIRGVAYCTRMSPQFANRVVQGAKQILDPFVDVFIYTDVSKGIEAGPSPGYGLSLVAESIEYCLFSNEISYEQQFETPEELGMDCAKGLLLELQKSIHK